MDEDRIGILFMWKCLYVNGNEPVERKKLTLYKEEGIAAVPSSRGQRRWAPELKLRVTREQRQPCTTRVKYVVQLRRWWNLSLISSVLSGV